MSDHAHDNEQNNGDPNANTSTATDDEINKSNSDDEEDDDYHIVVQDDDADGDDPNKLPQSNLRAILASMKQRARYDKLISARVFGSNDDDDNAESTTPESLLSHLEEETLQRRTQAFQRLVDRDLEGGGAKWKPPLQVTKIKNGNNDNDHDDNTAEMTTTVHRLSDIRYGTESPWQSLDIYFPEPIPEETDNSSTNNPNKRPVYIHIHGGGWSRGGKNSPFYGGPAMCQQATTFGATPATTPTTPTTPTTGGCISVAVGYRLGAYPDFVHDAAHAIQWVYKHIADLGGDLSNVFLSGHSAGGHIASLLIIRHDDYLAPLGVPADLFRGLVLVSGVYDLFKPMKTNLVDAKNKWFVLYYVTPAFGTDSDTKREASPLLLLNPDKETSVLGSVARTLQRFSSSRRMPSLKAPLKSVRSLNLAKILPCDSSSSPFLCGADSTRSAVSGMTDSVTSENNKDSVNDTSNNNNNQSHRSEEAIDAEAVARKQQEEEEKANIYPSTLILNATFDMGLQENGELMAEAMAEYTDVKYRMIPGTDHASICWNALAAETISDFVQSKCVYDKPKKKRRGKRDKWPRTKQTT